MCQNVCSDSLPHFRVTACLQARDRLPMQRHDILPPGTRHSAYAEVRHLASCLSAARLPPGR
jgi:hypothetical protein